MSDGGDLKEFGSKMSETYNESDLKKFESKVDNVMKILQKMNSGDKEAQVKGMEEADRALKGEVDDTVDETSFVVKVRENRTVINKNEPSYQNAQQMDKFTFMQQVEQDAEKRAEMRKELEKISQNFRKLGNEAFRKKEYEKAINMYSKAIDHVKDSPIFYNNRALCYIKLQLYKRGIIDCDFVLNKLDEKNLRSWLYRAIAYYKLEDEKNFETSMKMLKKNNPKDLDYIDKIVNDFINLQ